jgi:hypothetical protein
VVVALVPVVVVVVEEGRVATQVEAGEVAAGKRVTAVGAARVAARVVVVVKEPSDVASTMGRASLGSKGETERAKTPIELLPPEVLF